MQTLRIETRRKVRDKKPDREKQSAAYKRWYYKPEVRERICAKARAWHKNNRAKANAIRAAWRAKKYRATVPWANKFFIQEAYLLAKLRTAVLGGVWQVDHIVPLKSKIVSGLHCEQNLRVIPLAQNVSKGNRVWPNMPTPQKEMM